MSSERYYELTTTNDEESKRNLKLNEDLLEFENNLDLDSNLEALKKEAKSYNSLKKDIDHFITLVNWEKERLKIKLNNIILKIEKAALEEKDPRVGIQSKCVIEANYKKAFERKRENAIEKYKDFLTKVSDTAKDLTDGIQNQESPDKAIKISEKIKERFSARYHSRLRKIGYVAIGICVTLMVGAIIGMLFSGGMSAIALFPLLLIVAFVRVQIDKLEESTEYSLLKTSKNILFRPKEEGEEIVPIMESSEEDSKEDPEEGLGEGLEGNEVTPLSRPG